MIFLKLLLINGLTFYAVAAVLTDERSFKLLDYIIPQHYNIKIVPHATPYKQNIYYGECGVSIKILRPTHTINLHSNVQCITDVDLTDNPPRFQQYGNKEMIIYKPIKHLYDNKTHIVEFSFMNELSSGRYILNFLILPGWKEWTYCRGLKRAGLHSWKTLYRMGMEKSDIKFLEYLACSENPSIIINYLHLRYEQNITKPKYQKHVNSYLFTIAKHANNNDILEAILNLNKILPTQVSMAVTITVMINNIYNKDNFKQIIEFMIQYRRIIIDANSHIKRFYMEKIMQALRNMEQLTKKIENKIKIRCDQIDKQTEYFQNFLITE